MYTDIVNAIKEGQFRDFLKNVFCIVRTALITFPIVSFLLFSLLLIDLILHTGQSFKLWFDDPGERKKYMLVNDMIN